MATDNLVLEHLRAIRADLPAQRETLGEHSVRLTEIASSVAGLRRDQALDAEASAHLAARVDRVKGDMDRIKTRFDILDR